MVARSLLVREEVENFLKYFGVKADPLEETEKFLAAMEQFDPRFKDKRALVRYELEADTTAWPKEAINIIMAVADAMGMRKPETPLVGDWELAIVPGGVLLEPLDQLNYAVECEDRGECTIAKLTIVGSTRLLEQAERQAVLSYAPNARTEYDLCRDAIDEVNAKAELFCVNSETANTEQAIEEVIRRLSYDSPRIKTVAAVTMQIYQQATEYDLGRVANRYALHWTAVAGCPSRSEVVATLTTATYLSEVVRTLGAASRYTSEME